MNYKLWKELEDKFKGDRLRSYLELNPLTQELIDEGKIYAIRDYESSHIIAWVTKEDFDEYKENLQKFFIHLEPNKIEGKVFIVGTGGEIKGNYNDFSKLFYNCKERKNKLK